MSGSAIARASGGDVRAPKDAADAGATPLREALPLDSSPVEVARVHPSADGEDNVRPFKRPKVVLVVDDDDDARTALCGLLRVAGYQTAQASNGAQGLAMLDDLRPTAVLADLMMPQLDGLGLLRAARAKGFRGAFVLLTAHAGVESAVEAMRLGADDYLRKPLEAETTFRTVEAVIARKSQPVPEPQPSSALPEVIGENHAWRQLLAVVERAAPTNATVLILGESGTGKELIARAIHERSDRRGGPMVKVNCAALPESLVEAEFFGHERGAFTGAAARRIGRFELAAGGTLFLDEVGELPPPVQVKLLRALQNREFERVGGTETIRADVRVVAATNRDLSREVAAGRFREDLFYRLNVLTVTVLPLRDRKDDILNLARHFVRRFATAYSRQVQDLSPETVAALLGHDWPGNVRELENAMEHAVVLAQGREVRLEDLPRGVVTRVATTSEQGDVRPNASLYEIEREAILRTLGATNGSTGRAAQILGISARKIQYRLKEYAAAGLLPPRQMELFNASRRNRGGED